MIIHQIRQLRMLKRHNQYCHHQLIKIKTSGRCWAACRCFAHVYFFQSSVTQAMLLQIHETTMIFIFEITKHLQKQLSFVCLTIYNCLKITIYHWWTHVEKVKT